MVLLFRGTRSPFCSQNVTADTEQTGERSLHDVFESCGCLCQAPWISESGALAPFRTLLRLPRLLGVSLKEYAKEDIVSCALGRSVTMAYESLVTNRLCSHKREASHQAEAVKIWSNGRIHPLFPGTVATTLPRPKCTINEYRYPK